ncbi:MAG: efflux RND transporter periplasmic adaptor subunit [Gammaproteobacteria bacterium]|jgi:RND family efflux transporter MFP subunit
MRYLPIILLLLAPASSLAIEIDGQTDYARQLAINSSISGRIESIRVAVGKRVSAGQVVLRLVDTGLQTHVASASAEVDTLAPMAERMLTELEKAQELYARDSLAAVELQNAEQDHAIALAKLHAAEAKLARARFLLSQAEIRSPIDGLVVEINTFAGQYINTRVENQRLLTIVAADSMIASASLPYEMASPSLLRRSAGVRYGDRNFRGRVIEVGRQINMGNNSHPAVSLKVEFDLDGDLAAGLPVRITIADE